MYRLTRFRTDPDLCETLVTQSRETMIWLQKNGIRFMPIYGRQAFKHEGRFKFWGGLTLESWEAAPDWWMEKQTSPKKQGLRSAIVPGAFPDPFRIRSEWGKVRMEGKTHEIKSRAVVLACGGFESNTEWRTRYLGPGWEMAKVRGTCFNTGDGIRMALEVGASPYGNWSGCHAVGWDYNAPEFGDLPWETDSRNILPVWNHGQCHRQAFRGRRRRFPQLHLCQIWTGDFGAA